jgi:hypothetical protein
MTWKPFSELSNRQFRGKGLHETIQAGLVCRAADQLHPDWYRAISIKQGLLTLQVIPEHLLDTKLAEGTILHAVQEYCQSQNLPSPSRIRLTIARPSDNLSGNRG